MSWLSEAFGGSDKPMNAANDYLNQIPGIGKEQYNPYIEQGQAAGNKYDEITRRMAEDPTGFMEELMKGYKESDSYKYNKGQLEQEYGNTQAAGGFAGSPFAQQQTGKGVFGLLSADEDKYLQNALGINKTGLGGQSDIFGKGFEASKQLTDLLSQTLGSQSGLAFNNEQNKQQSKSDLFSSIFKGLGAGAGLAFGGSTGALSKLGSLAFGGGLGSGSYGGG